MFSLYGPVLTIPYSVPDISAVDVSVKLCGCGVLVSVPPRIRVYRTSMEYSGTLNVEIASTGSVVNEFSNVKMLHSVPVHKYRAQAPICYIGASLYTDGECASGVMSVSTFVCDTCNAVLDPVTSCNALNCAVAYYDALRNGMIAGTYMYGIGILLNRVIILYEYGVKPMDMVHVFPVIVNDDYAYVVSKYSPLESGKLEVVRVLISDIYRYANTLLLKNMGDVVFSETRTSKVLNAYGTVTLPGESAIVLADEGYARAYKLYFRDGSVSEIPFVPGRRLVGSYCAELPADPSVMRVRDCSTGEVVGEISAPGNQLFHRSNATVMVDYPFAVTYDSNSVYLYLIKCGDFVPVISYDNVNKKVKIVDYVTGLTLSGALDESVSRVAFPLSAIPAEVVHRTRYVTGDMYVPLTSEALVSQYVISQVTGVAP